jgi:hypothetical protein
MGQADRAFIFLSGGVPIGLSCSSFSLGPSYWQENVGKVGDLFEMVMFHKSSGVSTWTLAQSKRISKTDHRRGND